MFEIYRVTSEDEADGRKNCITRCYEKTAYSLCIANRHFVLLVADCMDS